MKWIKNIGMIILTSLLVLLFVPSEAIFASDGSEPAIWVKSETGKAGDVVLVDVVLSNNPGIAGVTLQVEYSDYLTLQAVSNGTALGELTFTQPTVFESPSRFLWDSERGMSQQDGTLLTLQFLISDQAPEGEELPICLSYTQGDIFNENLNDIQVQMINGTIKIGTEGKEGCNTQGHKYGTVLQKIEGTEVVPATNECLKQGSYKVAYFCERCGEYDPSSVQTIYTAAKGHNPLENPVLEDEVKATHKSEGSYNLVIRCKNCGEIISSTHVITEKVPHIPGKPVRENEIPATHNAAGSYDLVVYCTEESCKEELSRNTVIVDKEEHTPSDAVKENIVDATCQTEGSYDSVVRCFVCNEILSSTKISIAKLEHQYGTALQKIEGSEIVPAKNECMKQGSYKVAFFCEVCGEYNPESVRVIYTDAKGHIPQESPVKENEVEATHKENGSYDLIVRCQNCGEILNSTHIITDKVPHIPGKPVRENEVAATHSRRGSYDLVVYCAEESCGEELSRTTVTIDKEKHEPADAVKENVVDATCKQEGSYDSIVRCRDCNEILNVTHIIIPKKEHTLGNSVKENVILASCTEDGSYDDVIYCISCGSEISRTKTVVGKTGHKYVVDIGVQPTYEKEGLTEGAHCSVCNTTLIEQKKIAKLAKKNASIKVSKKTFTFKASKVKKAKQVFTINAKVNGNGKLAYKKVSGSKCLSVSKNGKVTLKKKTKKGTYKIVVQIRAAESTQYKSRTQKVIIRVKVK